MSASAVVTVGLARSVESAIAVVAQDISHRVYFSSITIATDLKGPSLPSNKGATQLFNHLENAALGASVVRNVQIVQPDYLRSRLAASVALTRRYRKVSVSAPAAAYPQLRVHRDIAVAQSLVGVSSMWSETSPGMLAIGLWTQYVDARLGIPLLHPARREPLTADVASAVLPTLLGSLIIRDHEGYVAWIWSSDLIGAELAGLALWTATRPDHEERIGPWEDPVVQRATELDLGVRLPSDLHLRPLWAGPNDEDGIATLRSLTSSVAALLNLTESQIAAP